jgi:hypothetical protein
MKRLSSKDFQKLWELLWQPGPTVKRMIKAIREARKQ